MDKKSNFWTMTRNEMLIDNAMNLIKLKFCELPLNRQIGVSRDALNQPVNVAQVMFVEEIYRNIETYEKNVEIRSIKFKNMNELGQAPYEVELRVKEGDII